MAIKPTLSEESFLGYIFSPKRHPQPSGLRKVTLKGLKGGRKAGRLAAFNRMSAANQQMLKMAGLRDEYLAGRVKLNDAKERLRPQGIVMGVARPTRSRRVSDGGFTDLDRTVAGYLKYTLRGLPRVNARHIDEYSPRIPSDVKPDVTRWSQPEIRHAARKGSEYEVIEPNGDTFNPFWYH